MRGLPKDDERITDEMRSLYKEEVAYVENLIRENKENITFESLLTALSIEEEENKIYLRKEKYTIYHNGVYVYNICPALSEIILSVYISIDVPYIDFNHSDDIIIFRFDEPKLKDILKESRSLPKRLLTPSNYREINGKMYRKIILSYPFLYVPDTNDPWDEMLEIITDKNEDIYVEYVEIKDFLFFDRYIMFNGYVIRYGMKNIQPLYIAIKKPKEIEDKDKIKLSEKDHRILNKDMDKMETILVTSPEYLLYP